MTGHRVAVRTKIVVRNYLYWLVQNRESIVHMCSVLKMGSDMIIDCLGSYSFLQDFVVPKKKAGANQW